MDDIKSALTVLDQLIAIRKAALAKVTDPDRKKSQGAKASEVEANHKAALRTLRAARRMLVKHRKAQERQAA